MARPIRMVLDLALISLKTVRGPISNLWSSAKSAIAGTAARPVVENLVVEKIEVGISRTADFILEKMAALRNKQLTGEKIYLEQELDKVNRKLEQVSGSKSSSSSSHTACEAARPCFAEAWKYAKIEMVPPMTQSFFQGMGGKTVEKAAGVLADTTMSFLRAGVTAIDAAAAQRKKNLEAALKAKQEKAAAEAKQAAEEKAKALAAEKAKQAEAAKAKASAEKAKPKAPEPKKEEPKKETKAAAKKPDAKKPEAKKPDPPKKK